MSNSLQDRMTEIIDADLCGIRTIINFQTVNLIDDVRKSHKQLIEACRAMMECAGPADTWSGCTGEALRLIENAVSNSEDSNE